MVIKHFHIGGMTCVNCQKRIENKLKTLRGVKKVSVDYKTGTAQVEYDERKTSFAPIEQAVEKLGYEILAGNRSGKKQVVRAACLLLVMIALYVVLQQFGVLNLLVPSQLADSSMGYGMLFVVGLLTSVHCIAMCGGINLSQCLPGSEPAENDRKGAAYLPAIFYNLGRVISYTVIGFLLGLIGWLIGGGSQIGVPTLLQGILKLLAGVLMVLMGVNMLGIFPWLRRSNIQLPGFITKRLGKKKAKATRPFVIGLLNGLMPCGPLQSIQILALASANPFTGALSMLLFSLGTVPLMLGLGSAVSALGKRFSSAIVSIGAVLLTVLGFAMIAQGGSLSGLISAETVLLLIIGLSIIGMAATLPFSKRAYRVASILISFVLVVILCVGWRTIGQKQPAADMGEQLSSGVQTVSSTLQPGQYPTITVQVGVPVRWTIQASKSSINGCNYKMILQEYGIEHTFKEGENVIEFTPDKTGTFSYSCWMGMIRGKIIVAE